jgi:YesN/AraC family two-component response regulator
MKVLFVDDETDVKDLYLQRFRKDIKSGTLEPVFAHNGAEAVNMLSEMKPDEETLVLSDINMPGMNGFDLLKFVKERFPLLKIFMVTAYGDNNYMDKARQFGADDFFTKPVNFDLLRKRMHLPDGR